MESETTGVPGVEPYLRMAAMVEARPTIQQARMAEMLEQMRAPAKRMAEMQEQMRGPAKRMAEMLEQMNAPAKRMAEMQEQMRGPAKRMAEMLEQMNAPAKRMAEMQEQMNAPAKRMAQMQEQIQAPAKRMAETFARLEPPSTKFSAMLADESGLRAHYLSMVDAPSFEEARAIVANDPKVARTIAEALEPHVSDDAVATYDSHRDESMGDITPTDKMVALVFVFAMLLSIETWLFLANREMFDYVNGTAGTLAAVGATIGRRS